MASWRLGEVFVLRHAGFPFDWLEELGLSDGALAQIDALLDAEADLLERARGLGEKRAAQLTEALAHGRIPELPAPELAPALERWRRAREDAEAAYARERTALRERLHARACDPAIQEAVFLSSPDMFENVWSRYVGAPLGPDVSAVRRIERQVYSYLQRLCAKNETASFFGPMGYGELDGEAALRVETVATRRRTFIAFWAVNELAQAITRDPEIWAVLPLRRSPIFRIEPGRALCPSAQLEVPLAPGAEALLSRLSRPMPLEALLEALDGDLQRASALLWPLLKAGVVVRELPYRPGELEAFASLSQSLAGLPESPSRERWLAQLARLEALRERFERAELPGRRELLPQLEATFTELTGKPARRGAGQMYTDRLVVYEEASSPFRLRLGRAMAERLRAALAPALELSAAYGQRVQQAFWREIESLAGDRRSFDFLEFAAAFQPEGDSGSQRFAALSPLPLPASGANELSLPVDAAGAPGEDGRYALPDVCLGKRVDGEFEILLARTHHHLLIWNWLGAFFPDRARFEGAARRWLDHEPGARGLAELAFARRNKGFYVFPGRRVIYSAAEPDGGEAPALCAADLRVELSAGRPELKTPEGERLFLYLPLADFVTYRPYASLSHPPVLHAPVRAEGEHTPRIRIGEAVYQRERWTVPLAGLEKLGGFELFLALRRIARARRWPRFLFARAGQERKPFLVDTASPFSAELTKHLSQGGEATFEEMLPSPEALWLRDGRGRYTFELRMQAERWTVACPQVTRAAIPASE